jgi:hypothetical protein
MSKSGFVPINEVAFCLTKYMLEDSSVAEFFKIIFSPKILFAIWLIGFIMLFAPEDFTNRFGLTEFIKSYRAWIGVVSLISFVSWVSIIVVSLSGYIKERYLDSKYHRESKTKTLA